MELRPYQWDRMVQPVRQAFATGAKRVLLTTATGGGKTHAFSYMAKAAQGRGNSCWIMVHRDLLVKQASRSLTAWGCPHGVLAAGGEHDGQGVQVVSIQTLSGRLAKGWKPEAPRFLISDEAHHACSASWRSVFDHFADVPTLGVTATPCRLDGKGLGDVFDRLVLGPTPLELMDMGFLCRPQYWGVPQSQMPELKGVGSEFGDFNKADLAKAVEDKPRLTGDVVAHYRTRAAGLKFIGFACNIKHATALRDAFNQAGIKCEVIHGALKDHEREDMVARLDSGELMGLWSVDLVSEGFDLPAVSCVILCRPTKSLSLHLQQIGRGLRLFPGKEVAIVLDHAGNLMRDGLGAAETPQEWTLEGVKKRSKEAETLPAVCQCPQCFRTFLRAPACPSCGYVFPVVERKINTVSGSLKPLTAKEIADSQASKARRVAQGRCETLQSLASLYIGQGSEASKAMRRAQYVMKGRMEKKARETIDKQLLASGRTIGEK